MPTRSERQGVQQQHHDLHSVNERNQCTMLINNRLSFISIWTQHCNDYATHTQHKPVANLATKSNESPGSTLLI
jgi:hypothetical protein